MSEKSNFRELCESEKKAGNSYASRFLQEGKNPLSLALEVARKNGAPQELIYRVEEKGMLDGSFAMTYEGASRIYDQAKKMIEKEGKSANKDYLRVIESFDPVRDSDLIATSFFCFSPEVREKASGNLENLYRAVLNVGSSKRKGYSLPLHHKNTPGVGGSFFPAQLREVLFNLPEPKNDEEKKYQDMLRVLVSKKAERDIFHAFKSNETNALKTLEDLANNETNPNVLNVYNQLTNIYRNYLDFQLVGVNPDFKDPETGEKGVLPSLHQKIGIYNILENKRFGIWDGGGTGKTAIAVLAQPLIEEKMKKERRDFERTIVFGTTLTKTAWEKGLIGNDAERYLAERQDIIVLNGERKDKDFLDEIATKKWIIANYEQLTTKIEGDDRLFIEALLDMGANYTIYDESHNIKSLNEITHGGKPTYSAAARGLALKSPYFVPMSATPISNGLKDFAIQHHLLDPTSLPNPEKFMELINNSPRILYTLFHNKSVRRTSEDINENLDWEEQEIFLDVDPIQGKIYNHIIEYRPTSWMSQARKALLDPRLVDPEILERVGVIGQLSWRNSPKYQALEKILNSEDGPIKKAEKFVVFSTMFREGVTQKGHQGLKRKYEEMGLEYEYPLLGLDTSLGELISSMPKGRRINVGTIDGTVKEGERKKIIRRLSSDLEGLVCTTETGGESLDLTAANHVYMLDEDYVPDTEEQALWRLVRKGQKKKVNVRHLRIKDSLDEINRDYVDSKRMIARMAMDGVPPTEDELAILEDSEGKRLGEMIKKSIGGHSINVYDAEIMEIDDFQTKKRSRMSGDSSHSGTSFYTPTDAQEVMKWIGKDPVNCWKDPAFVELYMNTLPNLSPPVVHAAKICDLANRARRGNLQFPRKVLSDGSGPSLLYDAYQSLSPVLFSKGLWVPEVTDRDFSKIMLEKGKNPNQVVGCMTGKDSVFLESQFDMVDNESISLLRNPSEVYNSMMEANRILKNEGLVELIVKNMRFQNEFYSGMEKLGFEIISDKNEGFVLSKNARNRLREKHGEHFVDSYASKLANTHLLLARKKENPTKANPEHFWFETLGADKEKVRRDIGHKLKEREESPRISSQKFVPEREVKVDKRGNVVSIKKIGDNE